MISIRQLSSCIGLSSDLSVLNHFYGYISVPGTLSLRTQADRLQSRHLHINLIRVGTDNNGSFSLADEQEIDAAVQFTRDTYAAISIGIGRVERYFITATDARGRQNIDSDDEASTLTDEWTVPNDAADVFFVLTYAGSTIGLSRVDGPCDKNAKGMDGSVVAIEGSGNTTGFVLAHELGHYLGLSHTDSDNSNLMFPSVPNGGGLSASQGDNMRDHCWVKAACRL